MSIPSGAEKAGSFARPVSGSHPNANRLAVAVLLRLAMNALSSFTGAAFCCFDALGRRFLSKRTGSQLICSGCAKRLLSGWAVQILNPSSSRSFAFAYTFAVCLLFRGARSGFPPSPPRYSKTQLPQQPHRRREGSRHKHPLKLFSGEEPRSERFEGHFSISSPNPSLCTNGLFLLQSDLSKISRGGAAPCPVAFWSI